MRRRIQASAPRSALVVAPPFLLGIERIPSSRMLASPVRMRIFRLVATQPGISMGELAHACGLAAVSLHYHIARLEEAGYVWTSAVGRRRLVYPRAPANDDAQARALLLEPAARRVALALCAKAYRSAQEIVDDLALSPRAVYHHLKRLRDAGLLHHGPTSRYAALAPTPKLVMLLAK